MFFVILRNDFYTDYSVSRIDCVLIEFICIHTMKIALTPLIILALLPLRMLSASYYISPNGNDSDDGNIDHPFASLAHVQKIVTAGDTVWIRGGKYTPTNDEIMGIEKNMYHCVYLLDKDGAADAPICYLGYPGERPVFDLSRVLPDDGRIAVFYVSGSWLHLANFDITGTQVVAHEGNTQSECISNRGGSHNVYENIAVHHGKGIGFYILKGSDNLVVNCDAYCNYDDVNDGGYGGNVDGFGGHPRPGDTGNVFRGCRSWWNSDDGFDLINANEAVRIENCWAFYNGYKPGTLQSAGDGNGFKAGGYGMKPNPRVPKAIPMHEVIGCIAYRNKAGGIYSNHHLGGVCFIDNMSYANRYNYNMVCRKSVDEAKDVDGYGHVLTGNVSFAPTHSDIINFAEDGCTVSGNVFDSSTLSYDDFESLDPAELMLPRKADGFLPEIKFLKRKH